MAGTAYNTIAVGSDSRKEEYTSAVTLTVGMIVQEASTGKMALSNVASAIYRGGEGLVCEAPERGKGIYSSGTTLNTYVATEQVPILFPRQGDKVLLILTDGQTITQGGLLQIAATGKAIAHAGSFLAYARALESLSPSGADGLILARIL